MTYLLSDTDLSLDTINAQSANTLPGHLGITIAAITRSGAQGYFDIAPHHMAPNGFLHAGSIVSFADSMCGMACLASLPATTAGFTTIELKSNFFATATEGRVLGVASPVHLGGTTQVWDCEVTRDSDDRRIAVFRCTQMVLKRR